MWYEHNNRPTINRNGRQSSDDGFWKKIAGITTAVLAIVMLVAMLPLALFTMFYEDQITLADMSMRLILIILVTVYSLLAYNDKITGSYVWDAVIFVILAVSSVLLSSKKGIAFSKALILGAMVVILVNIMIFCPSVCDKLSPIANKIRYPFDWMFQTLLRREPLPA